jgi:hypothetical protein
MDGMWSDDVDRLIERLEIRLEQYRLHADALLRGSGDHQGALALIGRLEARLDGLYEWCKQSARSDTQTMGGIQPPEARRANTGGDVGKRSKY